MQKPQKTKGNFGAILVRVDGVLNIRSMPSGLWICREFGRIRWHNKVLAG